MATIMAPRSEVAAAVSTCPYCGQALLDQAAVHRLHEAEREQESRLEVVAQAKAAELAEKAIAKATAEAEKKATDLEAQLKQGDRDHATELRKAKAEAAAEAKAATAELQKKTTDLEAQLKQSDRDHATELRKAKAEAVAEAKAAARSEAETRVEGDLKKLRRTIDALSAQNEEQQRRIENLTSEERGEFNEQQLVAELKAAFPEDRIERNPRGHRGADILQEVRVRRDSGFETAGTIVYECKDTLRWSNDFVAQARRSGTTHGSPYLVVITRAFPRGEKWISVRDGVVIVHPSRLVHVANVLHRMVEEVYRAGLTAEGQAAKTQELYGYLAGEEFREGLEALSTDADALAELLSKERTWHEGQWAKRQRLYTEVASKTSAIDARIRAIIERPADRARVVPISPQLVASDL